MRVRSLAFPENGGPDIQFKYLHCYISKPGKLVASPDPKAQYFNRNYENWAINQRRVEMVNKKMRSESKEMKLGDSVQVNPGVPDPDLSIDIGGWQGRIREFDGVQTLLIEWDSMTLRQMGMDIIVRCENDNLDWRFMTLDQNEVIPVNHRDSEKDVAETACELRYEMFGDPRLNDEP